MNIPDNAHYLSQCRSLIEEKLGWGNSVDWQNQDFENLSERIFEETKVLLSTSTLKRIWGKVRYQSTPNTTTLDGLAQFVGYPDWRTFKASKSQSLEDKKIESTPKRVLNWPFKKVLFIAVLILFTIFTGFWLGKKNGKLLQYENVQFTSKPVTLGLPNTVIFQYDASHSTADSVFIQQSWDPGRRFRVDKQLHEYTSTYYLPGYYRAKLILNDSIVKEHDVYIATEGWIGMIENNPIPVYLPNDLFKARTTMGIYEKDLLEQKIEIQKEVPVCTITKVDTSIDVPSENFSLLAQLTNTYNKSDGICQKTYITLFGTEGVIEIPLSRIGCVGEIGLMIGMNYIDGRTSDLSGFGVDFKKEVELRCETKNQKIEIRVNDHIAYTGEFKQNIGRLVGAKIKFIGTGVVHYFELK
jgi:hypothetical protein